MEEREIRRSEFLLVRPGGYAAETLWFRTLARFGDEAGFDSGLVSFTWSFDARGDGGGRGEGEEAPF